MRHITYRLKGEPISIRVVEDPADIRAFADWISRQRIAGFDTETTGLDWWNADRGFRCRLAQFGTGSEAWVIPVERGSVYVEAVRTALLSLEWLVAHNGTFDLHVAEACLGIPMEDLAQKMWDTSLLAHLVDPRGVKEKGPGLKLEELTKHYICPVTAQEVKGSMTEIAKRYKTTKEKIWALVDLQDEEYNRYAGMDPALAYRLFQILYRLVPYRSKERGLIGWEHRLAHVTAKLERSGYLLDVQYAETRCAELVQEQQKWESVALSFGVENPNSNQQLIEAFAGFGLTLTKRTKPTKNHPKGQLAMDDDVLSSLKHPLADAVIRAKKAGKWRKTWFERALNGRDSNDRVHGSINSLQARTSRMSISGSIPAQTFPSGDGYVRHMFLADEGHVSCSIDFGNMELRYLAAFSRDPTMLNAFLNNMDLHQITADAAGVSRKVGKMANFLTVFGGGWAALMEQAAVDEATARKVLEAFAATYPGVGAFGKRLAEEAKKTGYVWTATGRRLPVDPGKWFRALNYFIQGGSRDVTARAILELDGAGFTPYMRLPIHDEIVFSFPEKEASEMAREAARLMQFPVQGLLIPADAEIGKRSWGSVLELEDSKH
ncbi:DNA polymerase [Streptomyces sp. H27-H5]|uniref:DNA polymerase n=1 Tax=Streptomyces sp. H27-H5 TaxID=2996460 RepID=UPI0022715CBE|nr:DNA polymerase [Streptomyces sp. H27-H5]MCY0956383.1 DNA polymerase [Streptomyces sp. H27-H5]